MSTEANKALVRRLYEILNTGNLALCDEIMAPDYVDHTLPPGVPPNLDGFKQVIMVFRTAFPDLHQTTEDIIAEGDKVVARSTIHGTHKGAFFGIPPTGKQVTLSQIHIGRIVNGKMVEHWGNEDDLGLMQQLGVIPPMG